MTKYCAFDIETAKITPQGEDFLSHRPLGITCYAIAWQKGSDTQTKSGFGLDIDNSYAPQMSRQECAKLVHDLQSAVAKGFVLLAHNGVSFDLYTLAEESGLYKECAELARASVDTLLHVHCVKGFPIGLDAIAKGMRLPGKREGMSGILAPQMWADGKYDEVLAYVEQDARATLEVALEVERRRGLSWIAKSGRLRSLFVPRWLTAEEALQLPEPDTSWMTDPLPRSRFVGWMENRPQGFRYCRAVR